MLNKEVNTALQQRLHTLEALQTPRATRVLARILMVMAGVFVAILFVPWQQNIRGNGSVIAFNPGNRPQTVEAIIPGRISAWHVAEGQTVSKGDTIVSLTEIKEKYFDPELLTRLQQQIASKESAVVSKRNKAEALSRQKAAIEEGLKLKVDQLLAKLEAERVRFKNIENQYLRNKQLFEAGNIALTKFQDIEYKFQASQADLLNAQTELDRTRAEYLDKTSKSESDINSTFGEIFEAEAELAKLRNEFSNMRIRSYQYVILAPQSGMIVKVMQSGIGETVTEGQAICTIVPDAKDIAVEMYIRAMDVPLISQGRKVRIEFDGWPALQFSGWPSVSVGSFGGVVEVIDMVNSQPGEFRILVKPDPHDEAWPSLLRIGSGTKGWVMLDDVPVWYELWRQINGFPPSLYNNFQATESHEHERKLKEKDSTN